MTAGWTSNTPYSQELFLSDLHKSKEPVNIFLVNGIRLHGIVGGYDEHTVLLESANPQIIYKHAISTIMVARGSSGLMRDDM